MSRRDAGRTPASGHARPESGGVMNSNLQNATKALAVHANRGMQG